MVRPYHWGGTPALAKLGTRTYPEHIYNYESPALAGLSLATMSAYHNLLCYDFFPKHVTTFWVSQGRRKLTQKRSNILGLRYHINDI